jgi:hypothetical protein
VHQRMCMLPRPYLRIPERVTISFRPPRVMITVHRANRQ